MTTSKISWRRHLIALFCVILIFCTFTVPSAYADDVHIATAYQPFMYFEHIEGDGWVDLGTPPHSVVETGQPAYCLQMNLDSPYGSGYDLSDGSEYYDPAILNGLRAILTHGYPASTGGFTSNQAQYATANAIRFFLAENGIEEMPDFLRDTSNCRPKPGYEDLFNWCLELLEYGRHPDASPEIKFSSAALDLELQDACFVGTVNILLSNLNAGYTLDSSAFPSEAIISGYTGNSGDTLYISIPVEYEQSEFTLKASSIHSSTEAVLFFYAPTTIGQQRVVTCTLDLQSTTVDASMIVRTPNAPILPGSIVLSKTDENGMAVPGVAFALYDSTKREIQAGVTDENGMIGFSDLPLGDYFYAETATLANLVLDPTVYPVSITASGEEVSISAVNRFARGNVSVLKLDEDTGDPIAGVRFQLRDAAGELVAEGTTQSDGRLIFTGLLLGSYTVQETNAPKDYVIDPTPIPVEVTENGGTYEIVHTNRRIKGKLEIIKKDSFEPIYLTGAGFRLYDSSGALVDEGYTDAFGKLSFHDLPHGEYTYQEFKAPKGFKLDETVYPLEIREDGVTVTHTRVNERRPGTIEVKKQDANGDPFEGVAFLLEYSSDKGSTWHPVFPRDPAEADITRGGCTSPDLVDGQLITDETGKVQFTGLRADSRILYRLTETAAPEGYALISGSLYVGTLPIETENIYASDAEVFGSRAYVYTLIITATDDPVFRLPETGGSGFGYLPYAMLLCAAPIFIITNNTKRKGEIV